MLLSSKYSQLHMPRRYSEWARLSHGGHSANTLYEPHMCCNIMRHMSPLQNSPATYLLHFILAQKCKICRWKHFFSVWFKVGFSCTGVPTGGALTFVKMSHFRIQVYCIKSNKCLLPVRRSTSVLNCLYSTNDHQSCSESPQLRVVPPLAAPWRIYTSCVVPMTPKRTVSIQGWPVGGEISRRRPITSAS